jgi:hypothetical protein
MEAPSMPEDIPGGLSGQLFRTPTGHAFKALEKHYFWYNLHPDQGKDCHEMPPLADCRLAAGVDDHRL